MGKSASTRVISTGTVLALWHLDLLWASFGRHHYYVFGPTVVAALAHERPCSLHCCTADSQGESGVRKGGRTCGSCSSPCCVPLEWPSLEAGPAAVAEAPPASCARSAASSLSRAAIACVSSCALPCAMRTVAPEPLLCAGMVWPGVVSTTMLMTTKLAQQPAAHFGHLRHEAILTDLQDGVLVLQAGDLVLLGLHLLRQAVERLLQLLEAQLAPLPVHNCSRMRTRVDNWCAVCGMPSAEMEKCSQCPPNCR